MLHTRQLVIVIAALLLLVAPVHAGSLPDVDVVLVVEVRDANAWLAMHQQVLGSSHDSPTPLTVSIDAATAGRRAITVYQPRFDTDILVAPGVRTLKVVIAGKLAGNEALTTLTHFKWAVLSIQAGTLENSLTLTYGLSALNVQLVELQLSRP